MLKLLVIGHLGKDAIVNKFSGKNVINFSVAHSQKTKDPLGGENKKTTWVECAYWNESAAVAPFLKKGTQVYVEGEPTVQSYTTKEGTPGVSLKLRVSKVELLGGNSNEQTSTSENNSQSKAEQTADDDILPF